MPGTLQHYRVFIASPGGLQEERQAFREVLEKFNHSDAIPDGYYFEPIGWEDTLGGIGRPQELINRELRTCDFFVLMLHTRWGSRPGNKSQYSSGTEEEYHEAMQCHTNGTMRQLLILFKSVADIASLAKPDRGLARVLKFKKTLERKHQHLYKNFDSVDKFKESLRVHLTEWLRQLRRAANITDIIPEFAAEPSSTSHISITLFSSPVEEPNLTHASSDMASAWALANDGKLTEAETVFAKAITNNSSPNVLNEYGRFLIRLGLLDRAKNMLEYAQAIAEKQQDYAALASSLRQIGNILQTQGNLVGAQGMYRKSLDLSEQLGNREGMADAYNNLGSIQKTKGNLAAAENMHRCSLELNEQLGRREGMARAYTNLGNVLQIRGDLDAAEVMQYQSLEINEQLGNREGMATSFGNLGNVLRTRGDLAGAEKMQRKSLELNEQLGRREGIAIAYTNLGNILQIQGDLIGAETMQRRSIELNEQLGRREGMARAYTNLGYVLKDKGDFTGAKDMYQQGLKHAQALGAPDLITWLEQALARLPQP